MDTLLYRIWICYLIPLILHSTRATEAEFSKNRKEDFQNYNGTEIHEENETNLANAEENQGNSRAMIVNGPEILHERWNSPPYRVNLTTQTEKTCYDDLNINLEKINMSHITELITAEAYSLNKRKNLLDDVFEEIENNTESFINDPNEDWRGYWAFLRNIYFNKTTDFIHRIREYNLLYRTYICIIGATDNHIEFSEEEFQKHTDSQRLIINQSEYIVNISLLHSDIYYVRKEANSATTKYNTLHKLEDLEEAVALNRKTYTMLKSYLKMLEMFYEFLGNNSLYEKFNQEFVLYITDLEFWRNFTQSKHEKLTETEVFLKFEQFRIPLQEKIQPSVQGIIFIIGFIGNVLLLIVSIRHKEMRTASCLMILNLAVADTLNLVINIPTFYTYSLSSSWELGEALCIGFRFFRYIGTGVSMYSVVVICIQRFLAVNQFRIGWGFRMPNILVTLAPLLFAWLAGVLIAIPHTIHAGVYEGNCYPADKNVHADFAAYISAFDVSFICIIPVLIIATITLISAIIIKRSVKKIPGESMGMERLIKGRIITSNVLISLTVVAVISYLPLYLFLFLYARSVIKLEAQQYELTFFILYTLFFANSCINPIAIYMSSRKYRKYLNKYLFCCTSRK